jgi:hypothetical protein
MCRVWLGGRLLSIRVQFFALDLYCHISVLDPLKVSMESSTLPFYGNFSYHILFR